MKRKWDRTDRWEQELFRMAEREKMVIPESVYGSVEDTLFGLGQKRYRARMTWKKAVLLAAALTALCSVTVTAAVGALQQRMEAMKEQEMEDYFVQIHASKIGADNYNRPLTDAERQRMKELRTAYEQEALFPEKLLTMLSEPEAYRGKGVGFYKDTSTFFLPEESLSDEELLQMIDFTYKRDYSLQAMQEKIEAGEMTFPSEEIAEEADAGQETDSESEAEESKADESETDAAGRAADRDAGRNPRQELTVRYTGELSVRKMAAGQDCIYLTGRNSIHKMEIGGSDSEPFFDAFENDTYVSDMYEDKKGNLYLALQERVDESGEGAESTGAAGTDAADGGPGSVTIAGERYRPKLWILNAEKKVVKKIDLASGPEREYGRISMVTRIVVDEEGYIYLRGTGIHNALLVVLDGQGNYVKSITSAVYDCHDLGGLGIGRDGKVYTQIQDGDSMGIAAVDPEKGGLSEIYMDIVPEGTLMLDLIAPGSETDLVFWGYDGIFTYDLGEKKADNILPAYKAPCDWEGVMYCALPDGRIVFGDRTEFRQEGESMVSVPEKIRFYYMTSIAK